MTSASMQEAFEWTTEVVRRIEPDQLSQDTPCAGWSVRMVLNHMIGGNRAFAAGVPVGDVDPQCDPAVDQFSGGPAEAYADSWPAVVKAWSEADPEGSTTFPWGPMPNAIASQLLTMESVVHGWDLARATGQDAVPPDSVVGETLALATMLFADPDNRGEDFAPAIAVSAEAAPTSRLVAFLGRVP